MKKNILTHLVSFAAGAAVMFVITDIVNSSGDKKTSISKMQPKKRVFSNPMQDGLTPADQMNLMMKSMDKMMDSGMNMGSKFGKMLGGDIKVSEIEEDDKYKVIIKGEGIDKESLSFDINNGQMRVSGDIVKEEKSDWGTSRMQSSFSRAFSLPSYVDQANPKVQSDGDEIIISFNMK